MELRRVKAEHEAKMSFDEEKINFLQRETALKQRQIEEYEDKYSKVQEDLDLTKYKL
jgi:hypothetical protein